jgi:hypothetical protein
MSIGPAGVVATMPLGVTSHAAYVDRAPTCLGRDDQLPPVRGEADLARGGQEVRRVGIRSPSERLEPSSGRRRWP